MKKIVFLEGLPGIGKTTIVRTIQNRNLENVHAVDEIINPNIIGVVSHNQSDFMENDNLKYNRFDEGLIIIDRGFISTLSYNETLNLIEKNEQFDMVNNWFNNIKDIYNCDNVYTIYLTCNGKEYKISENDINGPYGTIKMQKELEKVTINNIKKYCKNYKIVLYDKNNMEEFIDEIISQYMCP